MAWFLKAIFYLPMIIKVGKQVWDLVEEFDRMKHASEALKEAKVGDASKLKELVNGLG